MYPNKTARELGVLLRISPELDVVGDVTAIVANPSELVAWATVLEQPGITAWRATDSGRRYVQVAAAHDREPIRGTVAAVLHGDAHPEFWHELTAGHDLDGGARVTLSRADLSKAWNAMPITAPT